MEPGVHPRRHSDAQPYPHLDHNIKTKFKITQNESETNHADPVNDL